MANVTASRLSIDDGVITWDDMTISGTLTATAVTASGAVTGGSIVATSGSISATGINDTGATTFNIKNASGSSKFAIDTYGQNVTSPYITWGGNGVDILGAAGQLDMNNLPINNVGAGENNWTANALTLKGGTANQTLTVETTGSSALALVDIKTPASSTGYASLQFYQGSGNGSANNMRYIFAYDGPNGQFDMRSVDIDGSSTDGDIFRVADGTDDMYFLGKVGSGITPVYQAHIYGAEAGEGTALGQLAIQSSTVYGSTPDAGIIFINEHTTGSQAIMGGIKVTKSNTGDTDLDSTLSLQVRKHGAVAFDALTINEDGRIATAGNLYVVTGAGGADPHASYNDLWIDGGANAGLTISTSDDNGYTSIQFGDTSSNTVGTIGYGHGTSGEELYFRASGDEILKIGATGMTLAGTKGSGTDTALFFDGEAVDYHIGLDDTADALVIGTGSTLGSGTSMAFGSTEGRIAIGNNADAGGGIGPSANIGIYGRWNWGDIGNSSHYAAQITSYASQVGGSGSGGTGAIQAQAGVLAESDAAWTGTPSIYGLYTYLFTESSSSGAVANAIDIYVATGGESGATFTNKYGIYIADQTLGTNDYGLYIAGADTYALWVDAGTSRFDGDVEFRGGDGAITLQTSGSIKIPDNSSIALVIEEANTAYMTFDTTNSGEQIKMHKNVEFPQNTTIDVSGSTARTFTIDVGGEDTYTQFTGPASGTATQIINAEGWRSGGGGQKAVAWDILNFGVDSTGTADRHTARIGIMTINNSSSITMANPTSLYIAGAPAAGTNMTLTAPYALWVDAGVSRFDGDVNLRDSVKAKFGGDGDLEIYWNGADAYIKHTTSGSNLIIEGRRDLRFWSDTGSDYTSKMEFMFNSGATVEFLMEDDGDFHADGNITAYSGTTNSDISLKKNINIMSNPLDKVSQLKGVLFDWKEDRRGSSAGVIAQDVEKVLPSLVSDVKDLNGDGTHKGVNYNGIIGLLVESIKELTGKVDSMQQQLEGLNG